MGIGRSPNKPTDAGKRNPSISFMFFWVPWIEPGGLLRKYSADQLAESTTLALGIVFAGRRH